MNTNSIRTSIIAATVALSAIASGVAVANTSTQTAPNTTPKVAQTKPTPTATTKPVAKPPVAATAAKTLEYKCASKKTLKVEYSDKGAKFELDKKQLTLPSVKTASGAKYSDGKTTLYTKGKEASVETNGKKVLDQCVTP